MEEESVYGEIMDEKLRLNLTDVNFWIKSKKYTKKLSVEMIDRIVATLRDSTKEFIIFTDDYDFRAINKKDVVDITFNKKDYAIFKNAARAEEKEKSDEGTI